MTPCGENRSSNIMRSLQPQKPPRFPRAALIVVGLLSCGCFYSLPATFWIHCGETQPNPDIQTDFPKFHIWMVGVAAKERIIFLGMVVAG